MPLPNTWNSHWPNATSALVPVIPIRLIFFDGWLKNEEYYPSQLLGFQIITLKNETIGLVKNIKNFGAGNLLEVLPINNKTYYIPMNDENVEEISFNKKIIIVNPLEGIIPKKWIPGRLKLLLHLQIFFLDR